MTRQSELNEHFVYIYRGKRGKARYVGRGRLVKRATSHSHCSHNRGLKEFVDHHRFALEIAGPYGSKSAGSAVETALISVLHPDLNEDPGPSEWRFRPIGVPERYAERYTQRDLFQKDFIALQRGRRVAVLFVTVSDEDFPDGRIGYSMAAPPTDSQICERVEKWWQLRKYIDKWAAHPNDSPGLLLGIHGGPGAQFVIASMLIDRKKWASAKCEKGGLIKIPLKDPSDLDAHEFRGRRIARSAGIKFGTWRWQQYVLLARKGRFIWRPVR